MNLPERDPYSIRTFEQLLRLMDNGDLLPDIETAQRDLIAKMREHYDQHGGKGCVGSMTLKIDFGLTATADIAMAATLTVKEPKRPAAIAAAHADEQGKLTLYSPLMKRMDGGLRDVTPKPRAERADDVANFDPETGEILDVSAQ